MGKHIGILTSGGDCPGLNVTIRGVARAGISAFDMRFIGFKNGIIDVDEYERCLSSG